jgi:hypothetical protein
MTKTAVVVNNFSECTINITLNFDYYEETGNEFKTIDSDEPDLARESILLDEIQHLLQSSHNRPYGTSLFEASKRGNARLAALRANEEAKRLTEKESTELSFEHEETPKSFPCILIHHHSDDVDFGSVYDIAFVYGSDFG